MFENFFRSASHDRNTVHCEVTGESCTLNDTVVLTKIRGFIVSKNFDNPFIDEKEHLIHSSTKSPFKYHSEIQLNSELKKVTGRLFTIVDDEDDLEQTTAIISKEGIDLFSGREVLGFIKYINEYEVIQLPETIFMIAVDNEADTKSKICECWNIEYQSVGKKYRFKKIINEKKEKQTFGSPGILWPGFDSAVSDCSQKNPNGTGYLFKTNGTFQDVNLSCNESAVEFCIKNNCLIYYNDFLNEGRLRILSAYTEDINRKLQNPYLFRSSNF